MKARALIAEDEPLLAASLAAELRRVWPELELLPTAGDGDSAVEQALALRPDVLFLDIRMPGLSGLDAAAALADDWPDDAAPFPLIVFVTAYDQYAVQAFERSAFDYLLKPVVPARLAQTCKRLQGALAARQAGPEAASAQMLEQLRSLLGAGIGTVAGAGSEGLGSGGRATAAEPPLRVIQAGVGNAIQMVKVDDVVLFEAADKYVRVLTAGREHLIRTSLRELLPRLDASRFWQVHRGTVVRADAIVAAVRDDAGKLALSLEGRPEKVAVSRLYAHLFKAM